MCSTQMLMYVCNTSAAQCSESHFELTPAADLTKFRSFCRAHDASPVVPLSKQSQFRSTDFKISMRKRINVSNTTVQAQTSQGQHWELSIHESIRDLENNVKIFDRTLQCMSQHRVVDRYILSYISNVNFHIQAQATPKQ